MQKPYLTEEQQAANKQAFIELVNSISIEGFLKEELLAFLEESDFYTAPASTKYHNSFKGGLCDHSLNVYQHLVDLYTKFQADFPNTTYSLDTLKVVALFHDLSKVNFYEPEIRNKKVYTETGTKKDNMGKFDWISEEGFKVREAEGRAVGGTHGFNSLMVVNRFVPLTYEESVAILNHHMNTNDGQVLYDLTDICNKYPLVTLLHIADLMATYFTENDCLYVK